MANLLKYRRIAPLFLLWNLSAAEADFNPLPKADEYKFFKTGRYSSGFLSGWKCESTSYRKRLDQEIAGSKGEVNFRDSNAVQCTVITFRGPALRDTSFLQTSFMDTLSFWQSSDSLFATGFDRFLNVFVPPNVHPDYPQGIVGASHFDGKTTVSFPKKDFQPHTAINWSPDCSYSDFEQITPCKQVLVSDYRYRSETLVFLEGQGFFSMELGWSGAPLGMAPTGATRIQLLQSVLNKDTVNFTGTVHNTQVNIRRQSQKLFPRKMDIGKSFDALGRDGNVRGELEKNNSLQLYIRHAAP